VGAIAVVAPGGALLRSAGDPDLPVVVRSTVKPFQALPLLLAGGEAAFALSAEDLALLCSSHSGTPAHRVRAQAMLERAGFTSQDLLCGAHRPLGEATAVAEECREVTWTALHNNCSGKHAGMLLACRRLGLDPAGYVDPQHPLQRSIAAELGAAVGLPGAVTPCGIDGCSAPTFALSLALLARGFAALAAPRSAGLDATRAGALGKLAASMAAHPEMVAGPGRFTTALIAATGGRLIGKEGAEGVYAVAIRGPRPAGLALKIADGAERARDVVVLELLQRLGAIDVAERLTLAAFDRPVARNHRSMEVGRIEAEFELD